MVSTFRRYAKLVEARLPDAVAFGVRKLTGRPSVQHIDSVADFRAYRKFNNQITPKCSIAEQAAEKLKETRDVPAFFAEVEPKVLGGDTDVRLAQFWAKACIENGQPERLLAGLGQVRIEARQSATFRKHAFGAYLLMGEYEKASAYVYETLSLGAFDKHTLLRMIADGYLLNDGELLTVLAARFVDAYADSATVREHIFVRNVVLNRAGAGALARIAMPGRASSALSADQWFYRANVARHFLRFDDQLEATNKALALFDLRPLSLKDGAQPLSAFNLKSAAVAKEHGPKVTILMSTYNSSRTVEQALESLSAQDYTNLEILVVDDCSQDNTVEVVRRYAAERDDRVRLIQADRNGGTYRARNIGLLNATGKFFTVNDSDDASHPQKISLLVKAISHSGTVASRSSLVRLSQDLGFKPKLDGYVHTDQSSLMYDREVVLERIGGYEERSFGADSEFGQRLHQAFGERAISIVDKPLLLSDWSPKSASGALETGITDGGLMAPVRTQYRAEYRHRHKNGELMVPISGGEI